MLAASVGMGCHSRGAFIAPSRLPSPRCAANHICPSASGVSASTLLCRGSPLQPSIQGIQGIQGIWAGIILFGCCCPGASLLRELLLPWNSALSAPLPAPLQRLICESPPRPWSVHIYMHLVLLACPSLAPEGNRSVPHQESR